MSTKFRQSWSAQINPEDVVYCRYHLETVAGNCCPQRQKQNATPGNSIPADLELVISETSCRPLSEISKSYNTLMNIFQTWQ